MSEPQTEFCEIQTEHRTTAVPLSHLSVELGHFYAHDLGRDQGFFAAHFRKLSPLVAALTAMCDTESGARPSRISTCVLIDDYGTAPGSPREVVPKLVWAAQDAGLAIDYLAREAGCAEADGISPAELAMARLCAEPAPDTTGSRPATVTSGWLCNGQRSPGTDPAPAMHSPARWAPPIEAAAAKHMIFVDVELWREEKKGRSWSCAFLASVWQLLRLGMLRNQGRPVVVPRDLDLVDVPARWDSLPIVSRLRPRARPFTAYRTMSILAPGFLPVEHAVRTIIDQIRLDPEVHLHSDERAATEGITLPPNVIDRIEYVIAQTGAV